MRVEDAYRLALDIDAQPRGVEQLPAQYDIEWCAEQTPSDIRQIQHTDSLVREAQSKCFERHAGHEASLHVFRAGTPRCRALACESEPLRKLRIEQCGLGAGIEQRIDLSAI